MQFEAMFFLLNFLVGKNVPLYFFSNLVDGFQNLNKYPYFPYRVRYHLMEFYKILAMKARFP